MTETDEMVAPAPVKPGVKTSEFWLTLAAMLVGALSGMQLGGEVGTVVATLASVLAALGYTTARGRTKAGAGQLRKASTTAAKALLLVALLGLGAAGCRTLSDADVRLIRTHKAANAAHAADETLPAEARLVAREAYDAFCVLDYSATGEVIPQDVRERVHGEAP